MRMLALTRIRVQGIVAGVPFVDCLTTMLDDSIPLTVGEYDEWGNPNEEEFYHYMKEYSPVDNIEKKVRLKSALCIEHSPCTLCERPCKRSHGTRIFSVPGSMYGRCTMPQSGLRCCRAL